MTSGCQKSCEGCYTTEFLTTASLGKNEAEADPEDGPPNAASCTWAGGSTRAGCTQSGTPWKMSDRCSGPIAQAPLRRLISKGEQFCFWNSWMQQKVFLIFQHSAYGLYHLLQHTLSLAWSQLMFPSSGTSSFSMLTLRHAAYTCTLLCKGHQWPEQLQGGESASSEPTTATTAHGSTLAFSCPEMLLQNHSNNGIFLSLWCIKTYFIGQNLLFLRSSQQQRQWRELLVLVVRAQQRQERRIGVCEHCTGTEPESKSWASCSLHHA